MNAAREDRIYGQPENMTHAEYRAELRKRAPDMMAQLNRAREDGDWRTTFTLEYLLDWMIGDDDAR